MPLRCVGVPVLVRVCVYLLACACLIVCASMQSCVHAFMYMDVCAHGEGIRLCAPAFMHGCIGIYIYNYTFGILT